MPIAAIAAPIIAIGATAASAATVGITAAATIFAAVGAVGAVVGAVGHFTGVKELSIAGSILGGIGAVGGLASGLGMFGAGGGSLFGSGAAEAASSIGAGAGEAGNFVNQVAPLAGDGIVAAAAPAGGYTLENLANSGLEGGIAGFGEGGGVGMKNVDIIDLVRGAGDSNFNPLEPAKQLTDAQVVAPASEALPNTTVAAAPQEAVLPEVAQEFKPDLMLAEGKPAGLIDSTGAMQRDEFGNVMAQGGGDPGSGQLGAGVSNPAQPPDPTTAIKSDPGVTTGVEAPQGTTPTPATASKTPAPATEVTGTTSPEANISNFAKGGGPQGPSPGGATAPTPGVASPTTASPTAADQSIWSRIFDMVESRPTLALGAIKAASSFISGAFSEGVTPEQRRAYAAQAEQNLAAANLARAQEAILQRRLRNMNDPVPTAQLNSPPPGLINSASAVTGRV